MNHRLPQLLCFIVLFVAIVALSPRSPALAQDSSGTTSRVSVSSTGEQANRDSYFLSISADGRFVAFDSYASNLVTDDTNGGCSSCDGNDIFVHDRQTGVTTLISRTPSGARPNHDSWGPSISADGRFVAFMSWATNLIATDTNGFNADIFVHDRQTSVTTIVSVSEAGLQEDNESYSPAISADGRYVAFWSSANLVAGDTNAHSDVFVHDRQTGVTSRVSVSSTGEQANGSSGFPAISADGRFVAFESGATNLVAGDTDNRPDIFVHDRQTGVTSRVSVSSTGEPANDGSAAPAISADGRFVAFESGATNLAAGDTNAHSDIFVHDRQTGVTSRVSVSSTGAQANGESMTAAIAADGRFVAFTSEASSLVAGDTNDHRDVFVHDRQTGITNRVSVSSEGAQGNNLSDFPALSADGQIVAFNSVASNLVAGDTNGDSPVAEGSDIFVHTFGYSISGRLTDPVSGDPIPNATLWLDNIIATGTDASGNYLFTDIPPGEHILTIPGYDTTPVSRTITLPPDAVDQDFTARLIVSSISGRVYQTTSGLPIANVTVRLDDAIETTTAADGTYLFAGLTTGDHSITIPAYPSVPESRTITLPPDATSQDFELSVTLHSISGQVLNRLTYAPVPGVQVSLGNLSVETDSLGRYQLDRVLAGNPVVTPLTPVKDGWGFVPFSLVAYVPWQLAGYDFAAVQDGSSTQRPVRVSMSTAGAQANDEARLLALSSDGRFALIRSWATNLSPARGDLYGSLFRHDLVAGETEAVWTVADPPEGDLYAYGDTGDMSADGSIVVLTEQEDHPDYPNDFESDLYIRDYNNGTLTQIYAPDGSVFNEDGVQGRPKLSADGNVILFKANSTNIVPGNTWSEDLYVYDRTTASYTRITQRQTAGGGDEISSYVLSSDGRYVAFASLDPSFVPNPSPGSQWQSRILLFDRQTGEYQEIGRAGDDFTNRVADISHDGRFVLFASDADPRPGGNLERFGVYLFDSQSNSYEHISANSDGDAADMDSDSGALSDDGNIVIFSSLGNNLLPGTPDDEARRLYALNRISGQLTRVDDGLSGYPSNDSVELEIVMTPDSHFVGFSSEATNLVPGDTNGVVDAFVFDLGLASDSDDDGVDSGTEDAAPNNGDGNNDGTPDSEQDNVASLPSSDDGQYITLVTPSGTALANVAAMDSPAPGTEPDDAQFPIGFLQFGIDGLAAGGATTVEILPENGIDANAYYKYGPTPGNPVDHWYEFAYDGTTGAEILPDKIVLYFVDGQRGDGDLAVNGDIDDPGAPAVKLPTIASFAPTSGPAGTVVSITGTTLAGAISVKFNGASAGFTIVSATQIDATVPAGATTGPISVTMSVGTATSATDFTVISAPIITGFTPASGPVGTSVTINGANFTGGTAVKFNGTNQPAFTVNSATQITAAVPVGATTGKIAITTPGGTAESAANFTVVAPPPPAIYLSPTGAGTIAGKSFTNADILAYVKATNTWDILYDGSYVRTPKNLGAFAFRRQDFILGFSVAQVVPGLETTKVAAQDLVRFTPTRTGYNNTAGTFAWFFDGSDVGLTTAGEIIDALWIDAAGRLYISTAGSGVVPANSAQPTGAKVKFQDEDVLRFTPVGGSSGANTAGTWELYWNPTGITGMSAEDVNGYWEDPATGYRYVTIAGAFNIGNAAYGGKFAGNGASILRFAPNAAAPGGWAPAEKLTWLAAGAALPAKFAIDGIEMAR